MTVAEVPLANLHENDYNPRKRFDDAAMEDLKNSIENVGLVQPPTARPLGNGDYEIISGTRRLKALRDLYDDDHEVPVYVRDVDDETAKWMALAENMDRLDLTPMEEALAFAKYVEIEVDGETLSYEEYIKGGSNGQARVPSNTHSSVKELAERLAPSADLISNRLSLLLLPDGTNDTEDVQSMVNAGRLNMRAAEIIARLRQIPDAEKRADLMGDRATDPRFSGDEPDLDTLRDVVASDIEHHQEQEQKQERKVREFREELDRREGKLSGEISTVVGWFNKNHVDDDEGALATGAEQVDGNGDGEPSIGAVVTHVTQRLNQRLAELSSEEESELDDRIREKQATRDRLQENLEEVVDDNLDRCPWCHGGIHPPYIEDKIDDLESEIESLRADRNQISKRRDDIKKRQRRLKDAHREYKEAKQNLESAKKKAGAA